MDKKEYKSVYEINANRINSNPGHHIPVYQIQGLDGQGKGLIMSAGLLEKPHDVLIRDFEVLKQFKCYMVSRLYRKEELEEDTGRYQMIKIIICKHDNTNKPLAYLCFNFNSNDDKISTIDNKIELEGSYSITFHFMEDGLPKYSQLYESEKYIGAAKLLPLLIKYLYDENVLKVINKLV